MNITDIQLELRKMEQDMAKMQQKMSELEIELEDFKPKSKTKETVDFKKAEIMAKVKPIPNRKLKNADDFVKRTYFKFLAMLADIDSSDSFNKFLFVARINYGVEYNVSLEDIAASGVGMQERDLNDIAESLEEYKYSLLADSLILANVSGNISEKLIKPISTMANFFSCDKEDMKVISTVSMCVLVNNFDKLDTLKIETNKWAGVFTHYIPENWLERRMSLVETRLERSQDSTKTIKSGYRIGGKILNHYNIKDGFVAKKGIKLAYYGGSGRYDESRDIISDKDGVVLILSFNDVSHSDDELDEIYIIHPFDDFDIRRAALSNF